jgi:phosphoglycerol transferase MdoB-like AlkP superfamily enzyme
MRSAFHLLGFFLAVGFGLAALFFALLYPDAWGQGIAHGLKTAPLAFMFVLAEQAAAALLVFAVPGRSLAATAVRAALAAVVVLIQVAQLFSLYYARDLLRPEFLVHAEMAGLLVNPLTTTVVGLAGAVLAALIVVDRRRPAPVTRADYGKGVAWLLGVTLLLFVLQNVMPARKLAKMEFSAGDTSFVAGFFAAVAATGQRLGGGPAETVPTPNATDVERAAAYGLFVDPTAPYPFVKPEIYRTASPYPLRRTGGGTAVPNVIVLFLESLSARLLGVYGTPHPGLTPRFDAFAREATVVRDYFNHAFPTVLGLRGQLCSLFPDLGQLDWQRARFKPKLANALCLPHVLARQGYTTHYFGPTPAAELFIGEQMRAFGFADAAFFDALLARLLPGQSPARAGFTKGGYGNSDAQMLAGLTRFVEMQANPASPFFVALSTLETHPGMDELADEELVYGDGAVPLLNAVHRLDARFGAFLDAFRRSPRAADTILIVTADHAHAASVDFAAVAGPSYPGQVLDEIVLMISSPVHSLPSELKVRGSSADLAPTIAQLLEVPNAPNAFVGRSLLADRQTFKGSLGLVFGGKLLINREPAPFLKNHDLRVCRRLDPTPDGEPCSLYRVIRYAQSMMAADRWWPGSP